MDPVIEIVDFKFDEERLIGEEWFHMVQHKDLIDMLLSGEGGIFMSISQVEDNMFASTKVGRELENEDSTS